MKLIFVYNAKSGMIHAILDSAHKLLSPSTYACRLCALTFDTFSEKKAWKAFQKSVDMEMLFYHIDEFELQYGQQHFDYPIVLQDDSSGLRPIITDKMFDNIKSTEELIETIKTIKV
ncbi:MAG: GTPase [Flavobacteriaceae bacterium]|nr:GTPase [Flavobacteriaceae bacterium]